MLCEIVKSMQYPHTDGRVDQCGPSIGIAQLCKEVQEFLWKNFLFFLKLKLVLFAVFRGFYTKILCLDYAS